MPPGESLDNPKFAYIFGKTEAEKAIWAYGEQHPELDITVRKYHFPHSHGPPTAYCLLLLPVDPGPMYGPLPDTFPLPEDPSKSQISSFSLLFGLIYPNGQFPPFNGYIDVRDTARLHVLALNAHNPNPERKKRFPLISPHLTDWDDAVALIAKERPELKPRLITDLAPAYGKGNTIARTDDRRVEDVFGFKISDYHTVESTVLDTFDSLVKLEAFWLANGHALPNTAAPFTPNL